MLSSRFFDRDPQAVAKDLLGKILRRRIGSRWLSAQIVEVEAYYLREKGSHASLGRTQSREALFMPAGTIYMYHARGWASLNVSCRGAGNAVLLKGGRPFTDAVSPPESLEQMHRLNPGPRGRRALERLCAGQTLLCRALDLRVAEWNRCTFDPERLFIEDLGYRPRRLLRARRLGIPKGRDEHLLYRFLDLDFVGSATSNPLTQRGLKAGADFKILSPHRPPRTPRRPEFVRGGVGRWASGERATGDQSRSAPGRCGRSAGSSGDRG